MHVFSRYGYRKASMDEVARAAGLSRQGLYLHFPSKESLFREVVSLVLEQSLGAGTALLREEKAPIEERLERAFDAAYGQHVGGLGANPHLAELLEAAAQLVGPLQAEREQGFRAAVARALERAGVAARWAGADLSAEDLAGTLDAVACGLKHRAASREAFREGLRTAIRLVTATPRRR